MDGMGWWTVLNDHISNDGHVLDQNPHPGCNLGRGSPNEPLLRKEGCRLTSQCMKCGGIVIWDGEFSIPDAIWDERYIYATFLAKISGKLVGEYSSPMEHVGYI